MVLQDNRFARDSNGFTQQHHRVVGVMEHIHKHHDVKTLLFKRKISTVKISDREPSLGTCGHFNSLKLQIAALFQEKVVDSSIATSHIENRTVWRNHPRQKIC